MRFLIILALVYLAWRMVRPRRRPGRRGVDPGNVDGEMIQDPVCGVYFFRRDGVRLTRDGKEIFFCSTACRDRYRAGNRTRTGKYNQNK